MFFADSKNLDTLAGFMRKAEAAYVDDKIHNDRLTISREIISYMHSSPNDWDERCSFNIKHIGNQYLSSLKEFNPKINEHIDYIYGMTYRFLCEFDFLVGPGKELDMELRSLKTKIQNDSAEIDDHMRSQIIYASYVMPANIAKEFINDANIGIFRGFAETKKEAETLKEKWDIELKSKKDDTEALKNKLEEYKVGFNFVGLYQGFSDLADKKRKESLWLLMALIGMGILTLTPILIEVWLSITGFYSGAEAATTRWINLIPILSTEVILIYFFRVILVNHRAAKAQIMQIELRKTLCQFIQSYASYSVDIKKQDPNALEKFESLIFSGIVADPEKLPSTFDGLEQIGNLIKSIKKD